MGRQKSDLAYMEEFLKFNLTNYHGLSSIIYCNENLGGGKEGGLLKLQAQVSAYWEDSWVETYNLRVLGHDVSMSQICYRMRLDPGDYVKELSVWYDDI